MRSAHQGSRREAGGWPARLERDILCLAHGVPWRDLPQQYGPYITVYNRFNRWFKAGIWDRIMDAVVDAHNGDVVMIDGTSVRVHHAAATLKVNPSDAWGTREADWLLPDR